MQVEEKCECVVPKKCKENEDNINPELKITIDRLAKKKGYTNYELDIKNIAPDGNNFLGLLTLVTVHNVGKEDLNLFIKSILPSAKELQMISSSDVYEVEIYAYLELSKKLDKLQADAHIPVEERYKFVRCYSESSTEHIIMENMIKKGYTIWNRFNIISLEYSTIAIKLLAKFHALGFVIQEKEPNFFEEKLKTLKYALKYETELYTFYKNMANSALENLDNTAKSKLKNVIESLYSKVEQFVNNPKSITTICHGDYRPGNILINLSEGQIKDMIPVDYQIIYNGSPIIDFMYFIFGATDREFRRKHLDDLKNLYYDTMKQFLKYFDMDIQKYYPKDEYERIFKEQLEYGLFIGILTVPMNCAQGDDIVDFTKEQLSEVKAPKSDMARIQIRELIDEFIDWGYL